MRSAAFQPMPRSEHPPPRAAVTVGRCASVFCYCVMLQSVFAVNSTVMAQAMPKPAVRDSAGVRIIEHQTIRTRVQAFSTDIEAARVGGLRDDPDEEIDVRGQGIAARLSNGNIAVAEQTTVRILDLKGKLVRVQGGRGSGPGQVSGQIYGLCVLPGDSILITSSGRRVSVFAPDGKHVRTIAYEYEPGGSCGPRGEHLGSTSERPVRTPGQADLYRAKLYRLGADAKRAQAIPGTFEANSNIIQSLIPVYFSAVMRDSLVWVGNGVGPEIRGYGLDGKLRTTIRWRDPVQPVTRKMLVDMAEAGKPAVVPQGATAISTSMWLSNPQMSTMPAYRDFFIDRAGRFWVRDHFDNNTDPARGPFGYTIFAPDGTLLGRYDYPEPYRRIRNVRVTDAGADWVVLRTISGETGITVSVRSVSRSGSR